MNTASEDITNTDENVELRRIFAADSLSMLILVVIAQFALIGIICFFIFMQFIAIPKPLYFNATVDEQIIEPVSLEQASLSSAAILNLVNEAVNLAYTFNYSNLKNQYEVVKPYFDERGLKSYISILQDDENMAAVTSEQLIVSAKVQKAPQIIREGNFKGRYTWQIMVPLLIRYENKQTLRRQEVEVELIVWRVPETVSPNRVKITNIRLQVRQRYNSEKKKSVNSF